MIHLHGFSHYSMQQGLGKPAEILEKAKLLGQKAIAITDFTSGYGLLEFYEKAKDVKPILGSHLFISYNNGKQNLGIVLLAKNYNGYKNLIKLISIANTKNYEKLPFLTIDELKQFSQDLIALSSTEGEIEHLILSNEKENIILDKIQEYEAIFNGEFYLEFLTVSHKVFPERKKIESKFKEFIEKYQKKGVITSFFKYVNKEDKQTYDVLLCIKNNWKYYDNQRPKIKGDYFIMDNDEVKNILTENGFENNFQDYLINQTHHIADQINIEIPLHKILFPKYKVPEKYKKLYEKLNKN